jgi:uncharacterized small protein (DUF1192 family)
MLLNSRLALLQQEWKRNKASELKRRGVLADTLRAE